MSRPMVAERRVTVPRAPAAGAVLPAHLKGTRAAIFFLLQASQAPVETAKPRLPASARTHPAPLQRVRLQAPFAISRSSALEGFFCDDQFEFRSTEVTSNIVTMVSMTRGNPAQCTKKIEGGSAVT